MEVDGIMNTEGMRNAGKVAFVIRGDYDPTATYYPLNIVFYNDASYVAKRETVGNEPQENSEHWHIFAKAYDTSGVVLGVKGSNEENYRTDYVNLSPENIGAVGEYGDTSNTIVLFEQALERENISSGEILAVTLGKLSKMYADMSQVAFSGSFKDLIDVPEDSEINVVSTYSPDGTDAVNGQAVSAALQTLSVDSVGGQGKYIQSISESGGKITAVEANMPTSLPANGGDADTVGGQSPEALRVYADLTGKPEMTKTTITLSAGWVGSAAPFTKNYTVAGMTADAVVWVDIAQTASAEQFEAYVNAKIANGGQSNNMLTFKAFGENPTISIPLDIAFLKEQ